MTHKPCPDPLNHSPHYQYIRQSQEKHVAETEQDHPEMSSSDALRRRRIQRLPTATVIHECRHCGTTCTTTDTVCPTCGTAEIVTDHC